MNKLVLSWDDVLRRVDHLAKFAIDYDHIYGIPRGGSIIAGLMHHRISRLTDIVNCPEEAQIAIDDIIDSGRTRDYYLDKYNLPTIALIDKQEENLIGTWVEFPWEKDEGPPRFIRDSPIATWDGRYEVEYQDIKCPFEHEAPTLVIHSIRANKKGLPYHFCSECLGLIYTMSPENPVIWKPSRTSTNLANKKKTVKMSMSELAKANPQVARALEAQEFAKKRERGEKLNVREFLIWREFNGKG